METLETRELRYFVTVAEELHFGRAAERLGMAQPPLSRAIQQLERRLGVTLLDRDRRGVALTPAGQVLLDEGRATLDAASAAARRTRRAGLSPGGGTVVLAVKAAGAHDLLEKLIEAHDGEIEVLLCGVGEQEKMLRDGRADAAIMHLPLNSLTGLDSIDLRSEDQVAILPAGHPLAARDSLTMAEVSDVPDLPLARWPLRDGSYPPGPGPEIREVSQLAQLIALGRSLVVTPESGRAWLWSTHVAVPVVDAPRVTTALAWPAHSRSPAIAALVRTAAGILER